MTDRDYYEGRIATLRTGIKMAVQQLQPVGILSDRQKADVTIKGLETLLDSDLDRGGSRRTTTRKRSRRPTPRWSTRPAPRQGSRRHG